MTQKKTSKRNYAFSDTLLGSVAKKVVRSAAVDILKFNTYGVSAADLDNFKTKIDDFRFDEDDLDFKSIMLDATEDKDKLAEKLLEAIRTVRTMAGNKWGLRNAKYRCYRFENMSIIPHEKLYRLGKRVVKIATRQLSDLASEGLTMAIINNIASINSDFDESIDLKEEAEINRDIATQAREEAGNEIYKELMRLCKIGQDIFATTNFVRAKIYTIYYHENVKVKRKKKNSEENKPE